MTTTGTPASTTDSPAIKRVTLAGLVGSFVEWYDYGIYGLLAGTLAIVFSPGGSTDTGLILTYVGFLVSFLVRPFGGVICGHLGDKIGRQRMLATLILLISGATAAIGLIPSFKTIGWAAIVLLICLRLLQGFSAGGEVAGAISFVGEYAAAGKRGISVSWLAVGSFSALLFGSVLSSSIILSVGEQGLVDGWWRVPFLLAVPLGAVGLYIRLRLEDTPRFKALREAKVVAHNPLKVAVTSRRHLKAIGIAIALPAVNGPGYYILFVYMPTYLKRELGFSQVEGLLVTAAGLLTMIVCIPTMARLSDRLGRRPVLIGSALAMAIVAYPGFLLIQQGSMPLAILAEVLLALSFSGHAAVVLVALLELFPTNVRYSAMSVGFNVTTVIFGGSAPLVMTWLIGRTGDKGVPSYAVVLTALITLVTALSLRETANQPLRDT